MFVSTGCGRTLIPVTAEAFIAATENTIFFHINNTNDYCLSHIDCRDTSHGIIISNIRCNEPSFVFETRITFFSYNTIEEAKRSFDALERRHIWGLSSPTTNRRRSGTNWESRRITIEGNRNVNISPVWKRFVAVYRIETGVLLATGQLIYWNDVENFINSLTR